MTFHSHCFFRGIIVNQPSNTRAEQKPDINEITKQTMAKWPKGKCEKPMEATGSGGLTEMASIRTLGKALDISPKTIQDWIYKSRKNPCLDPIPFYKINGLVRFNLNEIGAWLVRRRVRVGSIEGKLAA